MSQASGVLDMPQRNWNNIPDLLRAMPVKASVKDGGIGKMVKSLSSFQDISLDVITPRDSYAWNYRGLAALVTLRKCLADLGFEPSNYLQLDKCSNQKNKID